MLTFLAVIHILIGLGLVLFVLLQDPKGGAMGVFSGGSSSNTFFGASGATNFLTTTTKWLAVLFAATCLGLTYMTAKRSGSSVMDEYKNPPAATTPAETPAAPPAGGEQPQTESAPATEAPKQ